MVLNGRPSSLGSAALSAVGSGQVAELGNQLFHEGVERGVAQYNPNTITRIGATRESHYYYYYYIPTW